LLRDSVNWYLSVFRHVIFRLDSVNRRCERFFGNIIGLRDGANQPLAFGNVIFLRDDANQSCERFFGNFIFLREGANRRCERFSSNVI